MADERPVSPARTLQVADMAPLEWFEYSEAQGWGDGLPTLPPTLEAVEALLTDVDPAVMADIGPIPPAGLLPDLRSLAANAVMAGCPTAAGFLIVVAALEAVLDDSFNAVGVMATTHPCTPLVLVSGSVAVAARSQRQRELSRPGLPGERHYRQSAPLHSGQPGGLDAGQPGPGHPWVTGQVQLLLC